MRNREERKFWKMKREENEEENRENDDIIESSDDISAENILIFVKYSNGIQWSKPGVREEERKWKYQWHEKIINEINEEESNVKSGNDDNQNDVIKAKRKKKRIWRKWKEI